MTTKIGFDIGGVIVDTSTREPFEGALVTIKLAIEKFGKENIFIISKAKYEWIKSNLELFEKLNFYEVTGVKKDHVHFVDEFEDKKDKCTKLGVTYMIDDEIKVVKFCSESDSIVPIWFERTKEECLKLHLDDKVIPCKTWKSIRKLLSRIEK